MGKSFDMNYVNCFLLVVVLILVVVCCVKPGKEGFVEMVKKSRLTECQEKRDLCWKNKKSLEEKVDALRGAIHPDYRNPQGCEEYVHDRLLLIPHMRRPICELIVE
jgi:hypothetical protein